MCYERLDIRTVGKNVTNVSHCVFLWQGGMFRWVVHRSWVSYVLGVWGQGCDDRGTAGVPILRQMYDHRNLQICNGNTFCVRCTVFDLWDPKVAIILYNQWFSIRTLFPPRFGSQIVWCASFQMARHLDSFQNNNRVTRELQKSQFGMATLCNLHNIAVNYTRQSPNYMFTQFWSWFYVSPISLGSVTIVRVCRSAGCTVPWPGAPLPYRACACNARLCTLSVNLYWCFPSRGLCWK